MSPTGDRIAYFYLCNLSIYNTEITITHTLPRFVVENLLLTPTNVGVNDVAWSHDGTKLAVQFSYKQIVVWDTWTWGKLHTFEFIGVGHEVSFSTTDKHVVCVAREETVYKITAFAL